MTALDPRIDINSEESQNIKCIKDLFVYGTTDISEYDAIIAQEPCEAAEHIIRECVKMKKDFVLGLCGTPHRLISGEMPKDVGEWYQYLMEIDRKNCVLVKPKLIPGVRSFVMVGKF